MPTASTTPRIVRLTRQLVMNPIDRPSGSGNRPKLVRPGEYVVGMSSNLAYCHCTSASGSNQKATTECDGGYKTGRLLLMTAKATDKLSTRDEMPRTAHADN